MKKTILTFAFMMFAVPAFAQFSGGFVGPSSMAVSTVVEAEKMADDKNVILEGKIIQHIRKDKYMFEDATGSIIVEIDNDVWKGVTVTPEDKVRIFGEVDKSMFKDTKIEVDRIEKIK